MASSSGFSDLVEKIHDANLTLHVGVLKNEFMNFGFDYFADPMIEIATYSSALATDGIVTEFPSTAAAYFKSPCSDMTKNLSYSIYSANPGSLKNWSLLVRCLRLSRQHLCWNPAM